MTYCPVAGCPARDDGAYAGMPACQQSFGGSPVLAAAVFAQCIHSVKSGVATTDPMLPSYVQLKFELDRLRAELAAKDALLDEARNELTELSGFEPEDCSNSTEFHDAIRTAILEAAKYIRMDRLDKAHTALAYGARIAALSAKLKEQE